MLYRLSVNGDIHVVEADGDTPLLWVLRDLLGMTRPVKRRKALPKCEAQFEIRPIPKVGLKRREQQRSIDTRITIIRAALANLRRRASRRPAYDLLHNVPDSSIR
jgi:hypothetical protein